MTSINIHRLRLSPPLINSSCVWASELKQLIVLYESPFTGAVTTRTATLNGFSEDASHTVAFVRDTVSSLNSYGYSPHPLSTYLRWIESIIHSTPNSSKPFIVSITASSTTTLSLLLDAIQDTRSKLNDPSKIAVELNTSCPNIKGAPPPSYNFSSLTPTIAVLADYFRKDPSLTIGLKLPPYVYSSQFDDVIQGISPFSVRAASSGTMRNPIAFLTCTNTLGSSLLFADQTSDPQNALLPGHYAVPTALGGLAGESIHALSLGNVYTFTRLLAGCSDEAMKQIVVIGVGGVTTPEAVGRMQRAGARVVGCATILGREGVAAFEKLASGLK